LKVKPTGRSALVRIAPLSQRMTAHAGLVLVRELADALEVADLLDGATVKKRDAEARHKLVTTSRRGIEAIAEDVAGSGVITASTTQVPDRVREEIREGLRNTVDGVTERPDDFAALRAMNVRKALNASVGQLGERRLDRPDQVISAKGPVLEDDRNPAALRPVDARDSH
jgi:hypothetical protein